MGTLWTISSHHFPRISRGHFEWFDGDSQPLELCLCTPGSFVKTKAAKLNTETCQLQHEGYSRLSISSHSYAAGSTVPSLRPLPLPFAHSHASTNAINAREGRTHCVAIGSKNEALRRCMFICGEAKKSRFGHPSDPRRLQLPVFVPGSTVADQETGPNLARPVFSCSLSDRWEVSSMPRNVDS